MNYWHTTIQPISKQLCSVREARPFPKLHAVILFTQNQEKCKPCSDSRQGQDVLKETEVRRARAQLPGRVRGSGSAKLSSRNPCSGSGHYCTATPIPELRLTVWWGCHSSKTNKLGEKEVRFVVTRGGMGEGNQRAETCSFEINGS